MNFTLIGLSLGILLLLPAAEASCSEEFPDPSGDTNPSGLPGYYDLTGVRVEIVNGSLNWSWRADGISESVNAFYFGGFVVAVIDPETGQPHTGTGAPFFHPACNRFVGDEGIPTTECRLEKNDSLREGTSAVTFEFVADLNWSQQGDFLTVRIPADMVSFNTSTGMEWIYGSSAISASFNFGVAGQQVIPTYQVTPVYPDDTDSFVWAACHAAEAESMPVGPVRQGGYGSRDAAGLSVVGFVLSLAAVVIVRRQP